MYSIIDIETTGGKYNEEGITEIAIYRFDGQRVVDKFVSLVNPERPIQEFVVRLTGINNEMLRKAPKFYEVAKRIVEITEDTTLVAHNAVFDYRMLRTEFSRLGFDYERETLCTVSLSKKLLPGHTSYSLGKLVKELGIPLSKRHRADGDAQATVSLFKLLLAKDLKKEILRNTVKTSPKRDMDSKLLRLIEEAPTATGVYYLHREDGEVIYIGKSKNIKKRLTQHFTNSSHKARKIQEAVWAVSVEETGSDLVAQLKENEEIKANKPLYNRALKRNVFQYQLVRYEDAHGYINLRIEKANGKGHPLLTFTNHQQAKNFLSKSVGEHGLCQKLTGLDPSPNGQGPCFAHDLHECNGACVQQESPAAYNERITDFIGQNSLNGKSLLIIDQGRAVDERSAVLVEAGAFRGTAFFSLNHQINNPEVLRSLITPMEDNKDARHIIQSYLRRHKVLKVVELASGKTGIA